MKVMNLAPSTNDAGEKTLDVNVYGVIAQGFADTVDAAVIAKALLEHRDAKAITVHINSIGGDAFDGIAIHNMLKNHGAPVTSIVEGMAASAASIIAMAGKTVMGAGAMMMIHNPWTVAMGDAKELRRVAADLDKSRDSLVAIYKAKTGKSGQDLRAMLDAETLMTAEQAKRNGFADEIATDAETTVEASGDQVIFNRVAFPSDRLPQGVLNMARKTPPAPPKAAEIDPPGGSEQAPAEELQLEEEKLEAAPEAEAEAPPPAAEPAAPSAKGRGAVTRAELFALAPETMAAALADARAEGVKEERARVVAIDELGLKGCDDLVKAALRDGTDARDLAVAVVKAGKQAGVDILAARERESKEAAGVRSTAPTKNTEEAELAAAKNIAEHANRRRGGVR